MNDLVSRSYLLAEYDRQHEGPPGRARKIIEDAPSVNQWHEFQQEQNPETGLWEWVGPLPKDGQHILVSINVKGHEPVQADYWYEDSDGCWLDSGYDIGTEAIAWMPLLEPYRKD